MIFFARSGGSGLPVFLLALFALFLFAGGGQNLVPLVFLGMFFLLPVLLFRSAARRATQAIEYGQPYGPPPGSGYDPGYGGQQPVQQPRPVDPADVQSLLDRLGHDVRSLEVGDDAVSRQAMADASERYSTATGLLERARSQDQLRTAWLASVEGLHATRLVRGRLGLDQGPAPALPPGTGPQLQQKSRVEVDGREHVGAPGYEPGYSHWFPGGQYGGRYVPGGWYAQPFWPDSLMLGILSGWALGSLMTGGLYGGMYGDAGYGDGGAGGGESGDWGGGGDGGGGWDGGGDWGGGGGGWGDSGGGGGDWGGGDLGGGGDFGGGDW